MNLLTPDNLRLADAVIRELRDMIRLRLDQPGRGVDIRFGVMGSHGKGLWDAGIDNTYGCTGGPLGLTSDTLPDLYASIVEDLDDGDRRRDEDRKASEADDASV
jgi:hypothetical protein